MRLTPPSPDAGIRWLRWPNLGKGTGRHCGRLDRCGTSGFPGSRRTHTPYVPPAAGQPGLDPPYFSAAIQGYEKTNAAVLVAPASPRVLLSWFTRALTKCGYTDLGQKPFRDYIRGQLVNFSSPSVPNLYITVVVRAYHHGMSLVACLAINFSPPRRPGWSYLPARPTVVRATYVSRIENGDNIGERGTLTHGAELLRLSAP